jgi:hypothetical protein
MGTIKTAYNISYPKVVVQWLNHPDNHRDCASIKLCAWLTVLSSETNLCAKTTGSNLEINIRFN